MAGPWERYASPNTTDTPKGPWEKYALPTVEATPQQQTDALSGTERFAKGATYGLLNGAEGAVNTLGKTVEGADPQKLAKLQSLISAVKERMGVSSDQYAPASQAAQDPNATLGQRLSNVPRSVVEMAGPAVVGGLVGGLPGAIGAIGATEAGPTVDRVREADNTSPDKELTVGQKARVAAKVATDMGLAALGGKATLGAAEPIMATGLQGLKQAATQTGKAVGIDALAGSGSTAVDKALVDKQLASPTDLAVGAAQGGLPGLAMRGPRDFGGGLKARENIIESLDPQSRARVANLVQNKDGSLGRATKDLEIDLNFAKNSEEFDSSTKKAIAKAKADLFAGNELSQDKIANLSSQLEGAAKGSEVIQALQDINTLNKIKSLDDGGLSKSKLGQTIKPFGKWPASGLDLGALAVIANGLSGAHLPYFGAIEPTTAATLLGAQTAGYLGMKGIDKLSGASNVPKLLAKYAGGDTGPQTPITLAKAQAKASTISPMQQSSRDGEYNISTKHGDLLKNEADDLFSRAGRIAGTNRRVDSREAFMNKASELNISNEAKDIISANKDQWNQELLHNTKTRDEAKAFINDDVLSQFSPEDQNILRDHFENGKVQLDGDKKAMPYFMTWKHKTLEDLQKHKERLDQSKNTK